MNAADSQWNDRFDRLEDLVKRNAGLARRTATEAAEEVAAKLRLAQSQAAAQAKSDLAASQAADHTARKEISDKVDTLSKQMSEVLLTLNKLSTAKLLQVGIVALILAMLVIIGIKVVGG